MVLRVAEQDIGHRASLRGMVAFFCILGQEREPVMDKVSSKADLLIAALKVESMRQRAIASNVANLETPGYRRVGVKFEEMLAQKLDRGGGDVDVSTIKPEVYHPHNTPVKANGNNVCLETEVGAMVKNSLRHKTLMRLLIKKVNGLDKIINTP